MLSVDHKSSIQDGRGGIIPKSANLCGHKAALNKLCHIVGMFKALEQSESISMCQVPVGLGLSSQPKHV